MKNTTRGFCQVQHDGRCFETNLQQGLPIGIPLLFEGPQPNHFGAPAASRKPFQTGDFVGDTHQNGSCNVDLISLVPHCNGTHTESIGHIVNEAFPIHAIVPSGLSFAELISVTPSQIGATGEKYGPEARPTDQVITLEGLHAGRQTRAKALVVRTLPNDASKQTAIYSESRLPAYLTWEAAEWLAEEEIEHFLIDLPSIDRMRDGGNLYAHRRYWRVASGSSQITALSRTSATITEMIYVSDTIEDGLYLLAHGVASFASDAAPSAPVLFGLREVLP